MPKIRLSFWKKEILYRLALILCFAGGSLMYLFMRAEIIHAPKVELPSISTPKLQSPKLQSPNTQEILISLRGEGKIRYTDYTVLIYTNDPRQKRITLVPDTYGDMIISIDPDLLNSYDVNYAGETVLNGHINYLYVGTEGKLELFLK